MRGSQVRECPLCPSSGEKATHARVGRRLGSCPWSRGRPSVNLDTKLDAAPVDQLRTTVRGAVLTEGDAGYNAARAVWNAMIDRRPLAIVQCADAGDVLEAVRFARRHALAVSIRGGGHNVAGHAVGDGALTIDLSKMRAVRVDPAARRARAQ